MTYIFEDGPSAEISLLILKAYRSDTKIKFASSNVNLEDEANKAIESGEKDIVIFIDIIPGNSNTAAVYNNLFEKFIAERDDLRVTLTPIVC